jgi:hypothetical protein
MNETPINKAHDEKFCSDCGGIIKIKAEICPKCGVRQMSPSIQLNESAWMSVTALIFAILCFLNWFNLPHWDKDLTVGVLMFSIASLVFSIFSLQQKRKGKIMSIISIIISSITMLIVIGRL